MAVLKGDEAKLVNVIVRIGRASIAGENIDDLITEALEVLRKSKPHISDNCIDCYEAGKQSGKSHRCEDCFWHECGKGCGCSCHA